MSGVRSTALQPPPILRALLLAVAGDGHGQLVAGDLHEEFLYLCERSGRGAGKRWYASQVIRSLPELARLRIRSGEFTHLLVAMACAAIPLLLLDRLWCFVYSQIPLKDGLDRAPGFLAANVVVLCAATALSGAMAQSTRRAMLVSLAGAAGAAMGVWASVGAAPWFYVFAVVLAAPAGSLFGFAKWRTR